MRDSERIPAILQRLQKAWERHPDLRLCQLFLNLMGGQDWYHMEDEDFIQLIEQHYNPSECSKRKVELQPCEESFKCEWWNNFEGCKSDCNIPLRDGSGCYEFCGGFSERTFAVCERK